MSLILPVKNKIVHRRYNFAGGVIMGLLLMFGAAIPLKIGVEFLTKGQQLKNQGQQVEGRILNNGGGSPVFEYAVNGQLFRGSYASSSSLFDYQKGEQVKVLYLPDTPRVARIDDFKGIWMEGLFLTIAGLAFMVPGVSIIYGHISFQKRLKFLSRHGQRVQTSLVDLKTHIGRRGRNVSSWVIFTNWHDDKTNKTYTFRSDTLYKNPSAELPKLIDVVIDPKNPRTYILDLNFLQEKDI